MQTIGNLLNKDRFQRPQEQQKPKREINYDFEEARAFANYVGGKVSPIHVLKMFKIFGKQNVLSVKSWAADVPCDHRGKTALIMWELNKRFKKA